MNGARSTFMCKSYWLTALAAAVLLSASSGTAVAQTTPSVGFVTTSGSVAEDAAVCLRPPPTVLKVTVRATGLPSGDKRDDAFDGTRRPITLRLFTGN